MTKCYLRICLALKYMCVYWLLKKGKNINVRDNYFNFDLFHYKVWHFVDVLGVQFHCWWPERSRRNRAWQLWHREPHAAREEQHDHGSQGRTGLNRFNFIGSFIWCGVCKHQLPIQSFQNHSGYKVGLWGSIKQLDTIVTISIVEVWIGLLKSLLTTDKV